MNILRIILGIIAGYAIFVIGALLLFKFGKIDAHADPSTGIVIATIAVGILSSLIGGYVAQWISGTGKLTVNFILAVIMAGFAAFSLFKKTGNHYSQLAAIFLFAPTSILGGWFRKRKNA